MSFRSAVWFVAIATVVAATIGASAHAQANYVLAMVFTGLTVATMTALFGLFVVAFFTKGGTTLPWLPELGATSALLGIAASIIYLYPLVY